MLIAYMLILFVFNAEKARVARIVQFFSLLKISEAFVDIYFADVLICVLMGGNFNEAMPSDVCKFCSFRI